MTISNGSATLSADLDAIITTQLGLIQADNAQVPGGLELHLTFPNLEGPAGTQTPARRRKCVFVSPFDLYLETVAVTAGDHTAASTLTVTITGDGAFAAFPITITGTVGAGTTSVARLLFDGTKTAPKNRTTTGRELKIFPKGSTITISADSTSVTAASLTTVCVVMREFFSRE